MIFMEHPFFDQAASAFFEPYRESFFLVQPRQESPTQHGNDKSNNKRKRADAGPQESISGDSDTNDETTMKRSKITRIVSPVMHLNKEETQYILDIELPGAKLNNVTVKIEDNNRLLVEAHRSNRDDQAIQFKKSLTFEERYFDLTNVRASLSDGVLTVCVPKKELPKPVSIKVCTSRPDNHSVDSKEIKHWTFDLPGVKPSDVEVKLDGDQLMIRAERHRKNSTFELSKMFTLDPKSVDVNKLEAFLVDGVLEVVAPKLQDKLEKVSAIQFVTVDAGPLEPSTKLLAAEESVSGKDGESSSKEQEKAVAKDNVSKEQEEKAVD